jgi:tetratricopeptide (TPR) repeat protein
VKRRLAALALVWVGLAAAAPAPVAPPPPDLVGLLPWVKAPLDKPPVAIGRLPLPPPPVALPAVPPAPLEVPAEPKPTAPVPPPRLAACALAWTGLSAAESLECGRARFGRGEWEEALRALGAAVRTSGDRDLLAEARYWYAEALYRLGRYEPADWPFRQVAQDQGRREYGLWALHGSGWTALRLGDLARARDAFTQLLSGAHPIPLDTWGRHGLALALYGLRQYEEAAKVWAELAQRRVPLGLERDVLFWRAESDGRTGRPEQAVAGLRQFTLGGSHPLLGVAQVRLGWWSLRAGQPADAEAAFRAFLATAAGRAASIERDWAEAGLALALSAAGNWAGAREAARGLAERRSPLALPVRLRLAAAALEGGQVAETQALVQELLAGSLAPGVRPWVLLVKGDAHRAEGNRDEARTQFELARVVDPGSETGRQAALRLALTNFEMREFAQVAKDLAPLLAAPASPEELQAALVLQAEAAYHADDHATAEAAYRRVLAEAPGHPQASAIRLALAWTAMRQGKGDEARQQFIEFADAFPTDPSVPDALVLASELALEAGALDAARTLLDRVVTAHPAHPRTDFARLNRALLLLREGAAPEAERLLRDWIGRAPFPPLLGRAQTALGAALLARGAPAAAARAFAAARQEGVGALASLGLGVAALGERRWDEASRELAAARDTGTAAVAAAAEYGLAVAAFHRGAVAEFKKGAGVVLRSSPRGPLAPGLLYALAAVAADERDWPAALDAARRLAEDFPDHATADDGLERVGAAAAKAEAWPVAHEAYALLRRRYPQSPFVESSRLAWGRALLETGHAAEARQALEPLAAAAPTGPDAGQVWVMLGRAREAAGDQAGALEAFTRAEAAGAGVQWTVQARMSQARALAAERRWADARRVLQTLLESKNSTVAAEAAVAIGDAYQAEGAYLEAAEYYMTAAYMDPESPAGRRGLLGAGRSFAALKQPDAAETVYKKLLAQSGVPAELVTAARRGLAEIRR